MPKRRSALSSSPCSCVFQPLKYTLFSCLNLMVPTGSSSPSPPSSAPDAVSSPSRSRVNSTPSPPPPSSPPRAASRPPPGPALVLPLFNVAVTASIRTTGPLRLPNAAPANPYANPSHPPSQTAPLTPTRCRPLHILCRHRHHDAPHCRVRRVPGQAPHQDDQAQEVGADHHHRLRR